MKIRKMTVIAAIAVAGIINASCGNKQQQANSEAVSYTHLTLPTTSRV